MRSLRRTGEVVTAAAMAAAIAASAWLASSAASQAAPVACSTFRDSFLKATASLKSNFIRPLTVTRSGVIGDDVYDLEASTPVDAVLSCRGEKIGRFEVRAPASADAAAVGSFEQIQRAAMAAAFKWSDSHAATVTKTLNAEADEYLRASIQRGDVVLAGKTEYHEGGGDLGMLWTPKRHTFILVGQDD